MVAGRTWWQDGTNVVAGRETSSCGGRKRDSCLALHPPPVQRSRFRRGGGTGTTGIIRVSVRAGSVQKLRSFFTDQEGREVAVVVGNAVLVVVWR